ncbi:hypothetical protein GCM10025738_14240 [Microbacterium fluvii]
MSDMGWVDSTSMGPRVSRARTNGNTCFAKSGQDRMGVEPKTPPDRRCGAAITVQIRGGRDVRLFHPANSLDPADREMDADGRAGDAVLPCDLGDTSQLSVAND